MAVPRETEKRGTGKLAPLFQSPVTLHPTTLATFPRPKHHSVFTSYFEVFRTISPPPAGPISGVEISDHVTSLRVSVPAWVEFLHRERRQGQLAFLLSVHATVPPPPSSTLSSPPPTASMCATTAAADKTSESSEAAAGSASVGTPADNATSSGSPTKAAVAAVPGDGASVSPSRGKQPPAPAWTCVKTGRELSGAVQAFRENVAGSVAAGTWRPRPRPRVIKHMGTADQVRGERWRSGCAAEDQSVFSSRACRRI